MPLINVGSDAEFAQNVLGEGVALAGFTASWCPHCKTLGPKLMELLNELPELKMCRVDIDQAAANTERFGIMSVPTLAFFKDGKMTAQISAGGQSVEQIKEFITQNLARLSA